MKAAEKDRLLEVDANKNVNSRLGDEKEFRDGWPARCRKSNRRLIRLRISFGLQGRSSSLRILGPKHSVCRSMVMLVESADGDTYGTHASLHRYEFEKLLNP